MLPNSRVSGNTHSVFCTCLKWSSNLDADMICGVLASIALVVLAGAMIFIHRDGDSSLFEDPQDNYINFSTAPLVPVWQMPGFPNPFKHARSPRPTYPW